jgi:uncharacterized protein (DUF2141 family)
MIGPLHSIGRAGGSVAAVFLASLAASAWAQDVPPPAQGGPVTVVISGLRYPVGSVHVDICTKATFLNEGCPYSATAPTQVPDTTLTVPAVPPGVYAVQAFQDVNDNGKVDRNMLGIPREGIAFSNNAPLGLRGPSFARAAFTHGAEPQTLNMRLRPFGGPEKSPSPAGG